MSITSNKSALLLWLSLLALSALAVAGARDAAVTDVGPRALSLAWVVDEPLLTANVRAWRDAAGSDEISGLRVELLSDADALQQGIARVRLSGLPADSSVWLRAESSTAVGTQQFPADGSLIEALTASESAVAAADGRPLVGDLLRQPLLAPDGSAASGGLLLLRVIGLSDTPLSAAAGGHLGAAPGEALVDIANLGDDSSGSRAQISGGERLALTEYRGRRCVDPLSGAVDTQYQKQTRYRRMPTPMDGVLQVTEPASCFAPSGVAADFDCDGRVGPMDFNRLLGGYGVANDGAFPDCRYNPDFDLSADQRVGSQDFDQFLAVFGMQE